jgi:hypothetical protein
MYLQCLSGSIHARHHHGSSVAKHQSAEQTLAGLDRLRCGEGFFLMTRVVADQELPLR